MTHTKIFPQYSLNYLTVLNKFSIIFVYLNLQYPVLRVISQKFTIKPNAERKNPDTHLNLHYLNLF